jgi:antitoxin (DNA-binding transcriptional repressor) of toxin-antitoxin stability system
MKIRGRVFYMAKPRDDTWRFAMYRDILVEKEGETIEITNHGEVIAHLAPARIPQSSTEPAKRDDWTDLDRLAAEIIAHWPADISAVDAVRDVRHDLE